MVVAFTVMVHSLQRATPTSNASAKRYGSLAVSGRPNVVLVSRPNVDFITNEQGWARYLLKNITTARVVVRSDYRMWSVTRPALRAARRDEAEVGARSRRDGKPPAAARAWSFWAP